ncbi:MAG: phospholipid carrier-dependent glycosyltransferase, partial [SAR202 cluster bacterium]|nr:phospholipid carrier-dependent glycosyltransferase [SAR202 cluster bacterium]
MLRMTQQADNMLFRSFLPAVTPRRLALAALFVIVSLALALRLYGVAWDEGYPYTPHPDERAILQHVAELSPPPAGDLGQLLDVERSTWNPRWFPYGSLPLYLLKGVQLGYEKVTGEPLNDLRVAGRTISALADVVTLLTVYMLASRAFGRRAALIAAGLMSIAVLHIQLSHFYAVDTMMTMFAALTLFFLYRVAMRGRVRDSMLAGLCIGLGLATKTSLLPIFVAFGTAHIMRLLLWVGKREEAPEFPKRLETAIQGVILGFSVCLVAFFIAEPYAVLDWETFGGDWVEQSEMVQRIRDYPYTRQYIDTPFYWYQAQQFSSWGLGWPLGIAAWAGLAFAALRGMRRNHAISYALLGLLLPAAMLVMWHNSIVLVPAGLIVGVALMATIPLRRRDTRIDALILAWVIPYFLMVGAFEVKFMRYMLPITPFLLLFAARLGLALWEGAKDIDLAFMSQRALGLMRRWARPALAAAGVFVVLATAFYALAYMSVYSHTHPGVTAADWLRENTSANTPVLKEHWEEGLPELYELRWQEVGMYEPDSEFKFRQISQQLAASEYMVFYSNRMYANLPRLPERYPVSTGYYDLLFSGELGYELVRYETSYPRLWGVSFVDDTFNRPGVVTPGPLRNYKPSPVSLRLGFADESFTVYDHPKVLIFRNVAHHDASSLYNIIETAMGGSMTGIEQGPRGPVYTAEDAKAQQEGGTWPDIVREGSWTNRLPILAWLIVVEGLALLAFPLTWLLFRPLADRGYLFSKAVGLLAVGLIVWWLASLKWIGFSTASIGLGALALALASAVVVALKRRELAEFVRANRRIIIIGELVFLLAFFSFVAIRMANPDLWHPYRGGEKPMELAYLNAVTRSTYMPPYDPWFSGGYLNYYYWGQFLTGMLIKATGIDTRYAFNLAVPLYFAMTAAGAFAVAYNLAAATRRRLSAQSIPPGTVRKCMLSPVVAGLLGVALVTVLANLDGAIQVGHSVADMAGGGPFTPFDYWRSTRM